MKRIMIVLMSLAISFSIFGGEVSGAGSAIQVLKQHNLSVEMLQSKGLRVLLGEISGAGKAIDLDRINMVITKQKLYELNRASHIEFKHPSQARSLKDVNHLEFNREKIKVKDLKGLIYK